MNDNEMQAAQATTPARPVPRPSMRWQMGVGLAVVALALAWVVGVLTMPADTPWRGGGARLVPAGCAVALLLCGGWLIWEARRGGWPALAPLSGYAGLQVEPWVWVSTALLLGGWLLPRAGFVLSAATVYVLALQGLRAAAQGRQRPLAGRLLVDAAVGLLWAGMAYMVLTQVAKMALPRGALWN